MREMAGLLSFDGYTLVKEGNFMNLSILISKSYGKLIAIHWVVTTISDLTAIVFYPRLPTEVPTHFGFGTADSPGNKLSVFVLPIALILFGLGCSRRWIDRQYADLTIQNTLIKGLMMVLMVILWWGVAVATMTYYRLAW